MHNVQRENDNGQNDDYRCDERADNICLSADHPELRQAIAATVRRKEVVPPGFCRRLDRRAANIMAATAWAFSDHVSQMVPSSLL
jgi:hypothetical protein